MSNQKNIAAENGEFKKEISVFGGVSIVAGIMIGSGIFYLGSYVLQRANYDTGVALLCWLVGWRRYQSAGCSLFLGTWLFYAKGRRTNCISQRGISSCRRLYVRIQPVAYRKSRFHFRGGDCNTYCTGGIFSWYGGHAHQVYRYRPYYLIYLV